MSVAEPPQAENGQSTSDPSTKAEGESKPMLADPSPTSSPAESIKDTSSESSVEREQKPGLEIRPSLRARALSAVDLSSTREEGLVVPEKVHRKAASLPSSNSVNSLSPSLSIRSKGSSSNGTAKSTATSRTAVSSDSPSTTGSAPLKSANSNSSSSSSSSADRPSSTVLTRSSTYISSPLNPSQSPPPSLSSSPTPGARPRHKSPSLTHFARMPSEESRVFGQTRVASRSSMILYKVASTEPLEVPKRPFSEHAKDANRRASVYSTSGDSVLSLSSDSKYPIGKDGEAGGERGMVAYAYDPELDEDNQEDNKEGDWLHDSALKPPSAPVYHSIRGWMNTVGLAVLLSGLVVLFIVYPVVVFSEKIHRNRDFLIVHNPAINASGQAIELSVPVGRRDQVSILPVSSLVDPDTPPEAYFYKSPDGEMYDVVFSEEFRSENTMKWSMSELSSPDFDGLLTIPPYTSFLLRTKALICIAGSSIISVRLDGWPVMNFLLSELLPEISWNKEAGRSVRFALGKSASSQTLSIDYVRIYQQLDNAPQCDRSLDVALVDATLHLN